MTLIGAQTYNQLEQTAQKEFMQIVPDELVEGFLKQKNMLIMKNGHVVIFRALDDEGKIRSLNLSMAWIEEASEVKYDIYVQLTTRLRNKATKHHQLVLTTNPDLGWIKSEILLKADKIHNPQSYYHQDEEEINPDISVHIAPTHLNTYLPEGFWETVARNRPEWWKKRYLYGSFEHAEGKPIKLALFKRNKIGESLTA
jgi:phage terminase large subunit